MIAQRIGVSLFTLVAIEGHGEEHEVAGEAESTIHAVEAAAAH